MATFNEIIETIFEGMSPTLYFGGSYLNAFGIDPDRKVNGRISGAIAPTSIEEKGTLAGNPMWVKPNPITANSLIYTDEGNLYGVDKDLSKIATDEAGTSFPISLGADANGNGLQYFNNYYYAFKDESIDRYGPLDDLSNIAVDADWWKSTKRKEDVVETQLEGVLKQTEITDSWDSNEMIISDFSGVEQFKSAQEIDVDSFANGDLSFTHVDLSVSSNSKTDVVLSIQGDDAGEPDGTAIASATVNVVDGSVNFTYDYPYEITSTSRESLATFELDSTVTLTAGNKYWIVIEPASGASGYFIDFWGKLESDGNIWESGDPSFVSSSFSGELYMEGTGGWSAYRDEDNNPTTMAFRCYREENLYPDLFDKTYPEIDGVEIPNHATHFHNGDGNLYFTNYNPGGYGQIGRISTKEAALIRIFGVDSNLTTGNTLKGVDSGAKMVLDAKVPTSQGINQTLFSGTGKNDSEINATNWYFLQSVTGVPIDGEDVVDLDGNLRGMFTRKKDGFYIDGQTTDNALDLPRGYAPIDMTSYGLDIAILAVQTSELNADQGNATLFLWDTTSGSFYRQIPLPFSNASSVHSHIGAPVVFGGDNDAYGCWQYIGGESLSPIFSIDNGLLPFPGAVISSKNRILWGTKQSQDKVTVTEGTTSHSTENRLSVLAYGSQSPQVPKGVHNIFSKNADQTAYSISQVSPSRSGLLIGADAIYGEGGTTDSLFKTQVYSVGRNFKIESLDFTIQDPISGSDSLTVRAVFDNGASVKDIATITADDKYTGKQSFTFHPEATGRLNFYLEFEWAGGDNAIMLPVAINVETLING